MILSTLIVAYGLLATVLAFHLSWTFWKFKEHSPFISGVCFMAFAFGAICFCTLIFSMTSWTGIYPFMIPEVMAGLRFVIFSSVTGAYIFMMKVLNEMKKKDK